LGLISFALPSTPPNKDASAFPFVEALKLFGDSQFAIFFGASFLISLALAFYYSFTSLYLEQQVKVRPGNVGPLMTIGQWMEIFFLVGIPWLVTKPDGGWDVRMEYGLSWFVDNFGMKAVLLLGMAAWGLRYGIFAIGQPFPLIVFGLALHGLCFDFFFAAGMMHVDKTARSAIRSSAQSLYLVLTYGLGMYLGTEASGWVNHWCTKEVIDPNTQQKIRVTNWPKFWLIPCVGVIVCLLMFVLLFR
jgi:hypothetical protein